MQMWIDNDGCPGMVRDMVFKAAIQRNVPVTLVSHSFRGTSDHPLIKYVQVEAGFDAADHYIAEHAQPGDLVVTSDVPLADRIVKKGATGLNPRGEIYTAENIADKLSTRNLMAELRSGGTIRGGPPPLANNDKKLFADAFDRLLTKLLNAGKK